jgi:signal peptidase I
MKIRYSQSALNLVDESITEGEIIRLNVTSNSMYPLIRKGDFVIVQATPANNLSMGTIIVFRRDGELITHRFLKDDAGTVLTKGDNSLLPDAPVNKGAILGKVIQINRDNYQYSLDGNRAKRIATLIGRMNLISSNISTACEAVWSRLLGNKLGRIKIWALRVLLFPIRLIHRFVLLIA